MNNPTLNEYVDKIKEYTDTYFIKYIYQLECKNDGAFFTFDIMKEAVKLIFQVNKCV